MSCKIKFGNKIFNNEEELKAFIANNKEGIKDLLNQVKKETGQQNTEFFTEKAKVLSSKIAYIPVLKDINISAEVLDAYKIYSANGFFTNHISKMIPSFQEKQMKVAEAIIDFGEDFLDIGVSEGGLVKTVASLNKEIEAIAVDPNKQMRKNYESTPKVNNAKFVFAAFQHSWTEKDGTKVPKFETNNKFGVINEDFIFQFINNNRKEQVKGVKELLKPNGIFITSEKFINTKNYEQNEIKKYEHQSKYFTPKQLKEDKEGIVQDMSSGMVNDVEYFKILKQNFNYVEEFWNVGNFKGFLATDSKETLDFFKQKIGNLDSEFTDFDSATRTQSNIRHQLFPGFNKVVSEVGKVLNITNSQAKAVGELYDIVYKNAANKLGISVEEYARTVSVETAKNFTDSLRKEMRSYQEDFDLEDEGIPIEILYQSSIVDAYKPNPKYVKNIKGLTEEDGWLLKLIELSDRIDGNNNKVKLHSLGTKEKILAEIEKRFGDLVYDLEYNVDKYILKFLTDTYINSRIEDAIKNNNVDHITHWTMVRDNQYYRDEVIKAKREQQKAAIAFNVRYLKGNSDYSLPFRYLALLDMIKNRYKIGKGGNIETKKLKPSNFKTSDSTIHNFNFPALQRVYENHKNIGSYNLGASHLYEIKHAPKIPDNVFFEKYGKYLHKTTEEGFWLKFNQTEDIDDATDLYTLANTSHKYPASWCTGEAVTTAHTQLMDGDFYLFIDKDSKDARVAVRYDGQDRIGEVRGLGDGQQLLPEDKNIIEDLVNNFPDGESYRKYNETQKLLLALRDGELTYQGLTKDEIINIITTKDRSYGERDVLLKTTQDSLIKLYAVSKVEDVTKDTVIFMLNYKNNNLDFEFLEKYKDQLLFLGDIEINKKTSDKKIDLTGLKVKGHIDIRNSFLKKGLILKDIDNEDDNINIINNIVGNELYVENLKIINILISGNVVDNIVINNLRGNLELGRFDSALKGEIKSINIKNIKGYDFVLSGLKNVNNLNVENVNVETINFFNTVLENINFKNFKANIWRNEITEYKSINPNSLKNITVKALEFEKMYVDKNFNFNEIDIKERLVFKRVDLRTDLNFTNINNPNFDIEFSRLRPSDFNINFKNSKLNGIKLDDLYFNGNLNIKNVELNNFFIRDVGFDRNKSPKISDLKIDNILEIHNEEGNVLNSIFENTQFEEKVFVYLDHTKNKKPLKLKNVKFKEFNINNVAIEDKFELDNVEIDEIRITDLTKVKNLNINSSKIKKLKLPKNYLYQDLETAGVDLLNNEIESLEIEGYDLNRVNIKNTKGLNYLSLGHNYNFYGKKLFIDLSDKQYKNLETLRLENVKVENAPFNNIKSLKLKNVAIYQDFDLKNINGTKFVFEGVYFDKDFSIKDSSFDVFYLSNLMIDGKIFNIENVKTSNLEISSFDIYPDTININNLKVDKGGYSNNISLKNRNIGIDSLKNLNIENSLVGILRIENFKNLNNLNIENFKFNNLFILSDLKSSNLNVNDLEQVFKNYDYRQILFHNNQIENLNIKNIFAECPLYFYNNFVKKNIVLEDIIIQHNLSINDNTFDIDNLNIDNISANSLTIMRNNFAKNTNLNNIKADDFYFQDDGLINKSNDKIFKLSNFYFDKFTIDNSLLDKNFILEGNNKLTSLIIEHSKLMDNFKFDDSFDYSSLKLEDIKTPKGFLIKDINFINLTTYEKVEGEPVKFENVEIHNYITDVKFLNNTKFEEVYANNIEINENAKKESGSLLKGLHSNNVVVRDVLRGTKRIIPTTERENGPELMYQENKGVTIKRNEKFKILFNALKADVTTTIHELAHVFSKTLTEDELVTLEKWSGMGRDTIAFKEAFAKGAEKVVYDGSFANPKTKIGRLLLKFRNWFKNLIEDAVTYFGDINELNPEVLDIYRKMFQESSESMKNTAENVKDRQPRTSSMKYQIEKGNTISQIVGTFSNLPDNLKVEVRDELNDYYNDLFKRLNIKDFSEYKTQLEEVGKEKTYPEYTSEKSIYQATIKGYKEDFKNAETTSFRHQINDSLKNMFFKNKYVKNLNLKDNLENRWIIKYLKDYGKTINLQIIRTKEDLYKALEEEFDKLGDIINTAQGDTIYIEYITEDYINKQIKELKEGELDLEALEMWKSLQNNEEAQEKFVENLRKVQRENLQANWKTLKYENYPIGMKLLLMNQLMYNAHTYKKGDYYKKKRRTPQTHHVAPLLSELFLGELEEKAKFSGNNVVHDYFYIKEQFSKMKIDAEHYEKYKYKETENGIWYKFEAENEEHLEDFSKMSALSEGAGEASWCTGGLGYAKSYLMNRKNDMYIFYNTKSDVNNPTLQLAVQNGRLIEIGGLDIHQDIYERDLPDFNEFVENEKRIDSEEFINYTRYKKLLSDLNKNRLESGEWDFNRLSKEEGLFLLNVEPYYKDSGKLLKKFKKDVPVEKIMEYYDIKDKEKVFIYKDNKKEELIKAFTDDDIHTIFLFNNTYLGDIENITIKNKKIVSLGNAPDSNYSYFYTNTNYLFTINSDNLNLENVEFEKINFQIQNEKVNIKNVKFDVFYPKKFVGNFDNIETNKLFIKNYVNFQNILKKIKINEELNIKDEVTNIDLENLDVKLLSLRSSETDINLKNVNVEELNVTGSVNNFNISNSTIGKVKYLPFIKKSFSIENVTFKSSNYLNIKPDDVKVEVNFKNIKVEDENRLDISLRDNINESDNFSKIDIENIEGGSIYITVDIKLNQQYLDNLNIKNIKSDFFGIDSETSGFPDYSFNLNIENVESESFILQRVIHKNLNIKNVDSQYFRIENSVIKDINIDNVNTKSFSLNHSNFENVSLDNLKVDYYYLVSNAAESSFKQTNLEILDIEVDGNIINGGVLDFEDTKGLKYVTLKNNYVDLAIKLPKDFLTLTLKNITKDLSIKAKEPTNLDEIILRGNDYIDGSMINFENILSTEEYNVKVFSDIFQNPETPKAKEINVEIPGFIEYYTKLNSFLNSLLNKASNAVDVSIGHYSNNEKNEKLYLDLKDIGYFKLGIEKSDNPLEIALLDNNRDNNIILPKNSTVYLSEAIRNAHIGVDNSNYNTYDGPQTINLSNLASSENNNRLFTDVLQSSYTIVKNEVSKILPELDKTEFEILLKEYSFKDYDRFKIDITNDILGYIIGNHFHKSNIAFKYLRNMIDTIKEDIEMSMNSIGNMDEISSGTKELYKNILTRIGTEQSENLRTENPNQSEDVDRSHFRHQVNNNKSNKRKAVLNKLYNNIEEYKKVFPTPESFYNDPRSRDRFNSLGITLHDIYKAYIGLDPNKTSIDYVKKGKEVRAKAITAMKKAGFIEEQIEANMIVFEEYASKWARKNGRTPDEFFVDVISDFQFVDKKDLVPEEQKNASPREQAKAVKKTIWQKIKSFFSKDREGNTTPYEEDKAFEATVEGRTFRRENDEIIRGARKLLNDGTFIIYLTTDARVSTPVHELAHIFENFLTEAERQYVLNFFGHGFWNTKTSEAFARGFEEFLREGQKTDDKILQKVFDKFKEWLTSIFGGIMRANKKIVILNLPMRELYANMFDSKIKDLDRWEEEIETYNKAYNTALDKGGGVQFKKEAFDRILENQFQTPVVGYKSTHITQVASNVVEYGLNIPEIALRRAATALDAITMGQKRGMTGDPALTIEEAVGIGDALWQIQADISRLRDEIDRNINAGIDTTYSQTLLEEKLQESELLATVLTFYRSIKGIGLGIGSHFFNASMFSESEIEKEINRINANRRKANKKPLRKKDIRKIKEKAKNLRKLGEALYKLRDYDSKEAYKIRKEEADKYIADLLKEPLFKAILNDLKNYSTEELDELVNKTAQKLNEFYKANPDILYDKEEIDDQIIDENDMLYTLMVATLKEHPEITNVNELYLEMNKLVEDLSENRIVDAVMNVVTWNKNNLSKIARSNISKVKEEIRLIDKVDKLLLGDLKFAAKPEKETTEQIQTLKDIISEIKRLAAVQNKNNYERVEEFQKMFTLLANLENMYEDLLIGNKSISELTEQDIEQMIKTWNAYKEAAYYYKTGRYPGEKGLIQLYEDRIADLEKDIDIINSIFEKTKGKTIDRLRTVRRSREYLEMVEKYKKDITEKEKRYYEPEVFKLKVRFNKEKREFYELLRNKNANFWDVFLKELTNTPRVMVLAADYSYIMYQGLLLTAKNLIFHPVETIKLISSSFLTSISQSRYDKISKEIMDKDIYYDAWQHGLNVGGMIGVSLEEELQLKSVLERLPFFGKWMIKPIREFSERGYNAYMVRLRLNEYARLARNLDNVLAKETIAEHINTMTGSAQKFWFTKKTNETINNTINMMAVGFIAPRLYASTFKAMAELTTIPDIFNGLTSKNQDVVLAYKRRIINSWQILTGQIMYVLATYGLNYAFGSDDDREKFTDVFSSEFMKTHFGERVVTLNPFATYFRFLGRFIAKWVEYSKRKYIYNNRDWKKKTVFDIVWEDFLQYRLNPIFNAGVSIFGNVDYTGKMLEGGFTGTEYWTKAVLPNTLPIPISGLVQNIMKVDFSREPMESTISVMTGFALDVFGFNNYVTNPIRDNTVANHLKKIKYVYRSHYPDFLSDKDQQEIYRRVYRERVQEELGRRLRMMLKKNLKPDKEMLRSLQRMIELEIQQDMYKNGQYNK